MQGGREKRMLFGWGIKKTKLSLLDKRDEEQSDGGSWNIQKKQTPPA